MMGISSKKKRTIKMLSFLVVILIVFTCILNFKNKNNIEYILSSKPYDYLPLEAKNYIKEVYEETGEVILTEKNKEENVPYLNPSYVEYLTYSDEEKEKVDLIPNTYVVDYLPNNIAENTALPTSYNLSNVNNNNYLTPINDQGNLGLCWIWASIEQAESYLMVKNNQSYSSTDQRFSARQMDYATSIDGINNYENENGFRKLAMGGNFYMSSLIMSYGLSLTDYTEYEESTDKKELADVLNYDNSNYELKSSIMLPKSSLGISSEEYNNLIKENIIKYGGAYVGAASPTGKCGFKNIDGTYAIIYGDSCVGTSGHAMQIIGWDDDYEYSYCLSDSYRFSVNDSGTCSTGKFKTGKGAWILRNSWGDDSPYKYVYMVYGSSGYDLNFITSLTSMSDRTWDNVYHNNTWQNLTANKTTDTVIFTKEFNIPEKLEEVKFMTASSSGEYYISIESGDNIYKNIKSFEVEYPGIYTIDLTDKNILLDDSQFKVTISSTNDSYMVANTISAFTSNVDSIPVIKTKNIDGKISLNEDGNYEFIVYSSTKNIDSNEFVTYSLHKENDDYSNYIISYSNNKVAENNVNATLVIDKNIPVGNYKLKVHYNSYDFELNLIIPLTYNLQGSGTEKDPYLIYNEDDLYQIRYNLDAYYLLKDDITLTKNWVPIGTYAKPFKGGFDGGNHTINGLKIEENSENAIGLFGYVEVKFSYTLNQKDIYPGKTYIKNLRIKNAQVSNTGNASILIGQLIYNVNNVPEGAYSQGDPSLSIDSIYFIDGSVTSTNGDAGVIIGNISILAKSFNKPSLNINNIYSSITVLGNHSAGLIGYINDSCISAIGIMLKLTINNFQNVGVIATKPLNIDYSYENNYSAVIGGFYGNVKIKLSNYIINSIFDDNIYMSYTCSDDRNNLIGYYNPKISEDFMYSISNGYYVSGYGCSGSFTSSSNIKDSSIYNSWTDFEDYWKIETIDGIVRIPVLKDIDYNYTSASNISINRYDQVSLLDYINGASDFQYIEYSVVSNDNIIEIKNTSLNERVYDNITIEALNEGVAIIHVINEYDGYEKDITVTVTDEEINNPVIMYYYNVPDSNKHYIQQIDTFQSFKLTKNRFARNGYNFKEWNTKEDGTGTSYKAEDTIQLSNVENDTLRLYAIWEKQTYSVTFNANEGQGEVINQLFYYDSADKLSKNTFTKEGYKFKEWNTKKDGTGTSYSDRQEITIDEDMILYAIWIPNVYSIKFNSNGGIGTMNKQEFTYDVLQKIDENTFTKEGYTFKEWNTKKDGTGTTYSDRQEIKLIEDLTLYAIWEETYSYVINKYSIDEDNKYIDLIDINTTVDDFKKNINLNEGYRLEVDYKTINGKNLMYTGGKTKIYKNDKLYVEYTNIIRGDVNGNAVIDIIDYIRIMKDIMNTSKLTGVYTKAADVNQNGKIDIIDYIRIMKMIMEES